VSGIRGDRYELTGTQALYWHGEQGCCATLLQVGQRHLERFSWYVGDARGNWLAVIRPADATDREFVAALRAAVGS
jgi:hypothetical protein